MIKEFDEVVLMKDIPEKKLKKGYVGTIVDIHQEGAGYTLEFFNMKEDTISLATVRAEDVRELEDNDIAVVMQVAR